MCVYMYVVCTHVRMCECMYARIYIYAWILKEYSSVGRQVCMDICICFTSVQSVRVILFVVVTESCCNNIQPLASGYSFKLVILIISVNLIFIIFLHVFWLSSPTVQFTAVTLHTFLTLIFRNCLQYTFLHFLSTALSPWQRVWSLFCYDHALSPSHLPQCSATVQFHSAINLYNPTHLKFTLRIVRLTPR